ncbi:MAG: DUF6713 family protein, partial [Geminicoccaceae bacterium]
WLMVAALFTHELDAIKRHEWRILPLLRNLPDNVAEQTFIWLHLPGFFLVFWFSQLGAGSVFAIGLSAFAIVHVGLTWLLRKHPAYEYNNSSSWLLISLAGLLGALHLTACAMQ